MIHALYIESVEIGIRSLSVEKTDRLWGDDVMMSIPIRKAKLRISKIDNKNDLYYINFYSFMGIPYLKILFKLDKNKLKHNKISKDYIELPIKNMKLEQVDVDTFILKKSNGTLLYILNTPFDIIEYVMVKETEKKRINIIKNIDNFVKYEDPFKNPNSNDKYKTYIWEIPLKHSIFIKFKYNNQTFHMLYSYDGYLYGGNFGLEDYILNKVDYLS